jgi:hypothetical protein
MPKLAVWHALSQYTFLVFLRVSQPAGRLVERERIRSFVQDQARRDEPRTARAVRTGSGPKRPEPKLERRNKTIKTMLIASRMGRIRKIPSKMNVSGWVTAMGMRIAISMIAMRSGDHHLGRRASVASSLTILG